MGWQPESAAFRCKPGLLPHLQQAARGMRYRCCRADTLWVEMLTGMGGTGAGGGAELGSLKPPSQRRWQRRQQQQQQGRVSLSSLLAGQPGLLPCWVLFSFELEGRLSAMNEEVFIGPPETYVYPPQPRPVKPRQQVDAELQAFIAAGSRAAAEAAHSAASQGFLMLEPPLPLGLLGHMDTPSMLSLSRVCRQLRCASYELLRREEAACRRMRRYLGGSTQYLPLQCGPTNPSGSAGSAGSSSANPGASASASASATGSAGGNAGPSGSSRALRVADRRYMRCLSLLCGSPEAAAQQRMQFEREQKASWQEEEGEEEEGEEQGEGEGEGEGEDWGYHGGLQLEGPGAVEYVTTVGEKYEIDDGFSAVVRGLEQSGWGIQRVPLVRMEDGDFGDPSRCELFIVQPERVTHLVDAIVEEGYGEARRMLPVARAAALAGDALCVLHTLW